MSRIKDIVFKVAHNTLPVLSLISLAAFIILLSRFNEREGLREQLGLEFAQENAHEARLLMSSELQGMKDLGDQLAEDFSNGQASRAEIVQRLRDEAKMRRDIFSIGIGFNPEAVGPSSGDSAISYMYSSDGRLLRIQIEEFYDYTDPVLAQAEWYSGAIEAGVGSWTGPFFDEAEGAVVTRYAVPFYDGERNRNVPVGVVFVKQSVDNLMSFASRLDLGEAGYSYLLSPDGVFIAHPNENYVGETMESVALELVTVEEQSAEAEAEGMLEDLEQIEKAQGDEEENAKSAEATSEAADSVTELTQSEEEVASYVREANDPSTGEQAWFVHAQEPTTGWTMVSVIDKAVYRAPSERRIRERLDLSLVLMLFLLFVTIMLLRRVPKARIPKLHRRGWVGSVLASFILLGGMVASWSAIYQSLQFQEPGEQVVVNGGQLLSVENEVDTALVRRRQESPVKIPTGMVIQNLKFVGAHEVVVAGFLWQKYPVDLPDYIERGVLFPDVLGPEGVSLDEVYRFVDDGIETIGWNFRAELRQSLDFTRFPLDQERVRITVWPRTFGQGQTSLEGEDEPVEEAAEPEPLPETAEAETEDALPEGVVVEEVPESQTTPQAEEQQVEEVEDPGEALRGVMLVPDIDDYDFPAPRKKPGLARNMKVEGWELTHSYFSFTPNRYNTNFGSSFAAHQREFVPALNFNIGVRREVTSPMVEHGVTILVVLGLMFAVLLIQAESAYNVLTYAAALFFVLVISHVNLRSVVQVEGLVYLEGFYLALYGLLLFSIVSAMFAYSELDLPYIREEYWSKLFFWPIYWAIMLGFTLFMFYPRTLPPDPLDAAMTAVESTTGSGESEVQRD